MSNRIGLILLSVACIGLAIGLVTVKKQASERQVRDAENIETFSNQWVETKGSFEDQVMLAANFRKELNQKQLALAELSNTLSQTSANLDQATQSLQKDEAALKASAEEIRRRDAKISDLEAQNRALDAKAAELSAAITNLTTEIALVRRQLLASQGDKTILEQKLRQLMSDKADLERQFSDLDIVRAQVSKLKENLIILKRRDWIHRGLLRDEDQRGATKLMKGISGNSRTPAAPKPNYDLNVEVGSDGNVRIVQPTNAPAAGTNAPPKK